MEDPPVIDEIVDRALARAIRPPYRPDVVSFLRGLGNGRLLRLHHLADDVTKETDDTVGHEFQLAAEVTAAVEDGYFDATSMCKAAGKLFADYSRQASTKEFLEALSSDMGIPISELVQVQKGGTTRLVGTKEFLAEL